MEAATSASRTRAGATRSRAAHAAWKGGRWNPTRVLPGHLPLPRRGRRPRQPPPPARASPLRPRGPEARGRPRPRRRLGSRGDAFLNVVADAGCAAAGLPRSFPKDSPGPGHPARALPPDRRSRPRGGPAGRGRAQRRAGSARRRRRDGPLRAGEGCGGRPVRAVRGLVLAGPVRAIALPFGINGGVSDASHPGGLSSRRPPSGCTSSGPSRTAQPLGRRASSPATSSRSSTRSSASSSSSSSRWGCSPMRCSGSSRSSTATSASARS